MSLPQAEVTPTDGVKIDLAEQLRDATTQQRLQLEHQQQTLHRRAEDALNTLPAADLDQAVRQVVTAERQHTEHQQETAHLRAS